MILINVFFRDLINLLNERKVPVYLISGGFRLIINPIAKILGISQENVHANTLLFESNGKVQKFINLECFDYRHF